MLVLQFRKRSGGYSDSPPAHLQPLPRGRQQTAQTLSVLLTLAGDQFYLLEAHRFPLLGGTETFELLKAAAFRLVSIVFFELNNHKLNAC